MIGQQECNEVLKQIPRDLEKSFHVGVSVIRKKRGIYPDAANNTCLPFLAKTENEKCSRFVDLKI